MILMVTDGVTDEDSSANNSWIKDTLKDCKYRNPQDIADYMLAEAEKRAGGAGSAKDDMTVLAARVWEKV